MFTAVAVSPSQVSPKPRATTTAALSTAATAVFVVSTACQSRPQACWSPRDCSSGYECLAHVCTLYGGDPVDPETQRRALAVNQVQVHPQRISELPLQVQLGGNSERAQVLYLRFDLQGFESRQLARAFVLLAPADLSPPPQRPVELRARPLLDHWSARDVQGGSLPRAALDTVQARVAGVSTARFDVTEWARDWLKRPDLNHGVIIDGLDDAYGYTAALDRSMSPRLDVYWRSLDSKRPSESPP